MPSAASTLAPSTSRPPPSPTPFTPPVRELPAPRRRAAKRPIAPEVQAKITHAWEQLKQRGSQSHRTYLIEYYRYLVTKTRGRVIPTIPSKIAPEDLDGEGLIALIKAVDQFDPARKVKFESYAISMIRGAMLEYLRKEDWVPRSVRGKQKLLRGAEDALAYAHGEAVTDAMRADFLALDMDSFYQLFFEASVLQIVSIDDVVRTDEDDNDVDPLMVIESIRSGCEDPYDRALIAQAKALLDQAVGWLPSPERRVVRMYYYQGLTLKEIAKQIERSESRSHQLHAQAMLRLAGMLRDQWSLFVASPEFRERRPRRKSGPTPREGVSPGRFWTGTAAPSPAAQPAFPRVRPLVL